jgi:hypothetical protein
MKKQIAILATIIAASGFTAFGQDWITVGTSTHGNVWDSFSGPTPTMAGLNDVNIEVLWATDGTADALGAGTGTNSTGTATGGQATITSMLASGWTLAQNYGSGNGTAALGTVETATEGSGKTAGQITPYNGGNSFQLSTASTGISGSTIELVLIGFNGSASSYSTATALGWTSMLTDPVGLNAADPNGTTTQNGDSGFAAFGVESVTATPEPATLALACLGGLSMLGLRRRKA